MNECKDNYREVEALWVSLWKIGFLPSCKSKGMNENLQ